MARQVTYCSSSKQHGSDNAGAVSNTGVVTLLLFFESVVVNMNSGAKEALVGVTMDISKARKASKTLAGDLLPRMNEDVESWLGYWSLEEGWDAKFIKVPAVWK
jgi:hypothetical protein